SPQCGWPRDPRAIGIRPPRAIRRGLDRDLAERTPCGLDHARAAGDWDSDRALAGLFAAALEGPRRGGRRAAAGAAADRPRLLRAGGDWPLQPGWPRVYAAGGPRAAVHVRRAVDRVGAVFAAIRGAAVRGRVRVGRPPADRGIVDPRRVEVGDIQARRDP